jgi:D-amino-acid dehydrogenase
LATAYALVRDGHEVTVIEARDALGSETSFANGGQLSYRYVAPLADAGVPLQAIGWMLRGDSPLKLRPRLDPAQWRWMASFLGACRGSVNRATRAPAASGAVEPGTLKAGARMIGWTASTGGATASW